MHHNQPLECNGEDYTGDFLVHGVKMKQDLNNKYIINY